MPAITEVGQYKQDEKDALERWAVEVGIPMDQLEVRILKLADRAYGFERRSAARLAADNAVLRSRLAAQYAQGAQAENVVPIFPER